MMADACGGIVLVTSDDCKVNAEKLCSTLNDFVWTSDGGEWFTSNYKGKDIFVHYDEFNTKNPSVYLQKELCYFDVEEGESSDFSLEEFSNFFTPSIIEGWIEVVCTANENNRYVYFQSLRIYAGGKAVRKHILSGCCIDEQIDEVEVYEFDVFSA